MKNVVLRFTTPVDENDANQLQIKTRDAVIDELNKVKADLETTLEYNESYFQ
jgi:hypothetical protein